MEEHRNFAEVLRVMRQIVSRIPIYENIGASWASLIKDLLEPALDQHDSDEKDRALRSADYVPDTKTSFHAY